MQVALMAIVIAFLIGIPAGIVSAVKKGTAWDYGANLFAYGASDANFWLRIMLIFLFHRRYDACGNAIRKAITIAINATCIVTGKFSARLASGPAP